MYCLFEQYCVVLLADPVLPIISYNKLVLETYRVLLLADPVLPIISYNKLVLKTCVMLLETLKQIVYEL